MSSFLPHDAARYRGAGKTVTAQVFGDPPPWRAGRTPECEDSRRDVALEAAYRELGMPTPSNERALAVEAARLADLLADRERLAPRRYRPRSL